MDAVMTAAECCLPASNEMSTYGIHVTIGAVQVVDNVNHVINRAPNNETYYEFVRMDSGRIHTPLQYLSKRSSDSPGPSDQWNICIIELKTMYYRGGNDNVELSKASVSQRLRESALLCVLVTKGHSS